MKIGTLRAAAFCGALVFCASVTAAQAATFIDFEDLNTGGVATNPPRRLRRSYVVRRNRYEQLGNFAKLLWLVFRTPDAFRR